MVFSIFWNIIDASGKNKWRGGMRAAIFVMILNKWRLNNSVRNNFTKSDMEKKGVFRWNKCGRQTHSAYCTKNTGQKLGLSFI